MNSRVTITLLSLSLASILLSTGCHPQPANYTCIYGCAIPPSNPTEHHTVYIQGAGSDEAAQAACVEQNEGSCQYFTNCDCHENDLPKMILPDRTPLWPRDGM